MNTTDSREQEWLDAVENVFNYAKTQKPAKIGRSEVESLLIGMRSLNLSPKGQKVVTMLQSYFDTMKASRKNWLPIS